MLTDLVEFDARCPDQLCYARDLGLDESGKRVGLALDELEAALRQLAADVWIGQGFATSESLS